MRPLTRRLLSSTKPVDETSECDQRDESHRAVLSCGAYSSISTKRSLKSFQNFVTSRHS